MKSCLKLGEIERPDEIEKTGRSLMVFRQEVKRGDAVLAAAKVSLVCAASDSFKPVSVPGAIRKKLES